MSSLSCAARLRLTLLRPRRARSSGGAPSAVYVGFVLRDSGVVLLRYSRFVSSLTSVKFSIYVPAAAAAPTAYRTIDERHPRSLLSLYDTEVEVGRLRPLFHLLGKR